MRRLIASGTTIAVLAVILLSLGACSKHEEPTPVAALPPPLPTPPPAPSADDLLQAQLGQLGAKSSNGGWSVTLSSGKFRTSKVEFASDEQATLKTIGALLKRNPHLLVRIENYIDKRDSGAHLEKVSQMQANAVLRDLTSSGADESQIQAQGQVDTSTNPRVEIIFSNAEGEFHPAPVENS